VAVITLAEYKALNGITTTDKDTLISTLIPLIQGDIVEFCNYDFAQGTAEENFPDAMKLSASQMITFQMGQQNDSGVFKSESVDGYSYTRQDIGASGYPTGVETSLAKWRRTSFKTPAKMTEFRDRRGLTLEQLTENQAMYVRPKFPTGGI
jgi:hypothetical protein